MDVVVVGSCMIDLISYTPRLPQSGETVNGSKFASGFGGKGANQCVAARKLGCSSLLVARLGADSFGNEYLSALKDMGVSVDHVKQTDGISSGMASIIVSQKGDNQIVIVAGANTKLSLDDINEAKTDIESCKVLLTQMETPVETTIRALQLKHDCGSGISIFNAAPAQPSLPDELYRLPSIFCVNETEAELLTGVKLNSVDDARLAVVALQKRGCRQVIITLGADGAVYAGPNQDTCHVPTVPVTAVDTTGAGDSFIGTLAFYLSKKPGMSVIEAIRRSCAVAAISVQHAGTQASFPDLDCIPCDLI